MYKKISDYGIIGNMHSVALVGKDGDIDWLCLPHLDSSSVFAALLDADDGGSFSITPEGEWDSVLGYLEDSNVLAGRFRTRSGSYTLTDFMQVPQSDREPQPGEFLLVRLLQVDRGQVRVKVSFDPRFDYGRGRPEFTILPGEGVLAASGEERLLLCTSGDLALANGHAEGVWELHEGERVALRLYYGRSEPDRLSELDAERVLVETLDFWRSWLHGSGTGFFNDLGPHREQVIRSLLTLKLLSYQPRGTMAAAATTSLPETIGGVRNWDYRYSWVRDTSMALSALFEVGHVNETEQYLDWIEKVIVKNKQNELQVMYRMDGSSELTEFELRHLEGFRGSRPVRIGNGAATQKQFSIYGHVLIGAGHLVSLNREVTDQMWHGLWLMCEFAKHHWREPDWSIWEMRSEPRHYVHSKAMCGITLDRGLSIAARTGHPPGDDWEPTRDEIREDVMRHGWSPQRQAFVLHYQTDALDASSLLMSMNGFIPYEDPRMLATVEAIRLDLSYDGFIYRYHADDGLPGREGTFLACTLWLIANLANQHELEEAELLLNKVDEVAGSLHLLAEEYDPIWQEQLGNFPQAFSHEAYITAATAITNMSGELRRKPVQQQYLLFQEESQAGEADFDPALMAELVDELVREGGSHPGYGNISGGDLALRVGKVLAQLRRFDPARLKLRQEKISFWCNLFNLLVLHGVLSLQIKESVREIPRFYRRLGCRVGEELFTADIILHGILRGNRPSPGWLIPPLPAGAPRLANSIRLSDPRLLCAICTATASSAPMVALHPENLDAELDDAVRRFLEREARVDAERKVLVLPRIFKWYDDFGKSPHDVAVFVAGFLDEESARPIQEHPESYQIEYAGFDWRLP
ncbi:glycoside hydrolase [Geoanaerobacter pelophilus]|uniref:Glycoside hydrolase n=1 Tax=Geoanaerobacter pelophilus TaxID=60036 RepID=A0ABQ0MLS2_9BACT|nr:glycoside hydrolase family 15 protein [Geoanaerobacter pelophilus]GAW68019.1 glycoside hydrolase [Geoanaerobacter pelophilus]